MYLNTLCITFVLFSFPKVTFPKCLKSFHFFISSVHFSNPGPSWICTFYIIKKMFIQVNKMASELNLINISWPFQHRAIFSLEKVLWALYSTKWKPRAVTCVNGPVHKERSVFIQIPAMPGGVYPWDLKYLFLLLIKNSHFVFWTTLSRSLSVFLSLTLLTQIRPWIFPLFICSSSHGRIRCLSIGIFTLLYRKVWIIHHTYQ